MYNFRDVDFDNELVPESVTKAWIDQSPPALEKSVCYDYQSLYHLRFDQTRVPAANERKLYLATAGAPCTGKSTELDLELARQFDPRYDNAVLIDPDRWVMEYMTHTFRPMMSAGNIADRGVRDNARHAYAQCRPGANIIANLLLNEAFDDGRHIVHGTTLTDDYTGEMLKTLGDAGYERRLMICACEEAVREDASHRREEEEGVYQVTQGDFREKARLAALRMADYFAHGDNLLLMWKDDVATRATLAAEYVDGTMYVHDEESFAAFKNKYAADRAEFAREKVYLPDWDSLEFAYMNRTEWLAMTHDPLPKLHP